MNFENMTTEELQSLLVEDRQTVRVCHHLIDQHQKILNDLESVNQDGSRDDQVQNHEDTIDDYQNEIQRCLDEIELIVQELDDRVENDESVGDGDSIIPSVKEPFEFSINFLQVMEYFSDHFLQFIRILLLFFALYRILLFYKFFLNIQVISWKLSFSKLLKRFFERDFEELNTSRKSLKV